MKEQIDLKNMINDVVETKMYILSDKPHYQKYLEIRKKTDRLFAKMLKYYANGNYDFDMEFKKISKIIFDETTEIKNSIELNWQDDKNILVDLIIFKNFPSIKCICNEFLSKKLYENKEEQELLKCMLNSQISLYKIVKCYDNGFEEIQDLITNKRIKIVDVASSLDINSDIYMINRIISYNGISFGTGLGPVIKGNNKEIDNYLKYKIKNKSKLTIIMELRDIINKQNEGTNMNFMYHYYT